MRAPLAAALPLLLALAGRTDAEGECPDIHGRAIAAGLHYVPGPDTCTLCICDSGQPKWCKAVLCSPPQDCKSLFRQGNTCCEFICLDDALSAHPDSALDGHQDFGLRLIASAVTVVLFLSVLFFMVHRLRQRKLRGHQSGQINDDRRSLASIGYIGGSLGYLEGGCDDAPVHFPSLWKPPGNYFPRGEAPPPYDEAVAQARAEAVSISNVGGFHRSFPIDTAANIENLMRIESNRSANPRGRNLLPPDDRSAIQFNNNNPNNNNTRLLTPFFLNNINTSHMAVGDTIADMRDRQVVVMDNNRSRSFTTQHSISSSGNNNFISTLKITSSLAAVTNISRVPNNREQTECSRNNFMYNSNPQTSNIVEPLLNNNMTEPRILPGHIDMSRHRTIPRMIGNLDDQLVENRSFMHLKQRPNLSKIVHENNVSTLPENISKHISKFSIDSNNPRLITENIPKPLSGDINEGNRFPNNSLLRFVSDNMSKVSNEYKTINEVPQPNCKMSDDVININNDINTSSDNKHVSSSTVERPLERHPLLSMPTDMALCGCSYESETLAIMNDDQDDYHSECENCKSANGSRYYLDESEEGSELCETMTLHRRPLSEHAAEDLNQLPTSLTLPVKTKRSRCSTGSRDAWFSSMPGTSSSEED